MNPTKAQNPLTIIQRLVLTLGLLCAFISCVYISFEATYIEGTDVSRARLGHFFIWSPPDPITVCIETFGMELPYNAPFDGFDWHRDKHVTALANRACSSRPIYLEVFLSILASIFATGFLLLFLGATHRKRKGHPIENDLSTLQSDQKPAEHLVTSLKVKFGDSFPVASGSATQVDPLIIVEPVDYVAVEYAIVKHLLGTDCEYKLRKQSLIVDGGRRIDCLAYDIRAIGNNQWTENRDFYFDISIGFNSSS